MSWKEKRRARIIFKQLKAGLKTVDSLNDEEIKLLRKYYPFLFRTTKKVRV